MPLDWITPQFAPVSTALVAVCLVYLLAVAPVLTRRTWRILSGGPNGSGVRRMSMYRRSTILSGVLAVVPLVLVAADPGTQAADLGIRLDGWGLFVTVLSVVVVVGGLLMVRRRGHLVRADARAAPLLPRTGYERRWFLLFAVANVVYTELMFRGLLIAAGVGILGAPVLVAAVVAVAVFVATQAGLGRAQVIGAASTGAFMTFFYLTSGTVVVPIVINLGVHFRTLVTTRAAEPATPGGD